jgi:4-carboxymuconolactone decarboxylase
MPTPSTSTAAFQKKNNAVWKAFEELSKQCHHGGLLDEKTRRLVKIALAIGAGLEGGTHSAVRHAKESGVSPEEMEHVVLLAVTTLGFPAAMRAFTWIRDSK